MKYLETIDNFLPINEYMHDSEIRTAFLDAKKYSNKQNIFIHFTDIPKLGVNPKKSHHDPYGIYFYPLKWIMNPDNYDSFQYGIRMKYYYICKVDTSNFINLNKLKYDDIVKMFEIAGYKDLFYRINFADIKHMNNKKSDGAKFFALLDMLNVEPSKRYENQYKNLPLVTWNQFFSRLPYDGVIDNNGGIINENEPSQIIVFNPKVITTLSHGENKISGDVKLDYFKSFEKEIGFTSLESKYIKGGRYYFIKAKKNNKIVYIYFNIEYNNFKVFYLSEKSGGLDNFATDIDVFNKEYGKKSNIKYFIEKAFNESKDDVRDSDFYQLNKFMSILDVIFNKVNFNSIRAKEGVLIYNIFDVHDFTMYLTFEGGVYNIHFYGLIFKDEYKFTFKTSDEFINKYQKILSELDTDKTKTELIKYCINWLPFSDICYGGFETK